MIRDSTGRHIDTGLAVVDGKSSVGPSPVPDLLDRSDTTIEGRVAEGHLLVTKSGAYKATVKGQIGCKSSGPCILSVLGCAALSK